MTKGEYMEKKNFIVTGMTCSACSARVERVVSKVKGVKSVNVNLLKNSMSVIFDGAVTNAGEIVEKVEEAGYGAALKSVRKEKTKGAMPVNGAQTETELIKKRFIASLIFTLPLFYTAMGPMIGLPLPSFFAGASNSMILAFTQFLLAVPVVFINGKYFQSGFKNLLKLSPNMDSLIALGSGSAFVYGTYSVYKTAYGFSVGDTALAHEAAMNLYFESAAMILTLITLGKFLEARAKGKTSQEITKLINLAPKTAVALRNGTEEEIPVEDVVKGDILIVKSGDTVPADGIIEEGNASIDESAITGESLPADKSAGDKVTGATVNVSGYFKMKAVAVGDETALARIISLVDEATSSKAPIARLADKISYIFVPAVMFTALCASACWLISGYGGGFALSVGISVLVISCPCALGLATPTAIMAGMGRGASNGILIKSAQALETARMIDTAVIDKTGTITEGKPVVTDIIAANGDEKELLVLAASIESMSNHPLAGAVVKYASDKKNMPEKVSGYNFIHGEGISGIVKGVYGGAPDGVKVFGGNRKLMEREKIDISGYIKKGEDFSRQGKIPLYFAKDKTFLGIIALADTLKAGSAEAVAKFRQMGIDVVMLTGDNAKTARFIGELAGVDAVVSDLLPEEKEREIRALQKRGKKVAMIGDGINDAPALARADVGIAIGAGTDIAIESADIVLMRSDLNDAVTAVRLSRATVRNIKQNLFWAFIYNAVGIPLAAGALYKAWGILLNPMIAAAAMSFSSVSVVSNALRLRFFKPEKAGNKNIVKKEKTMKKTIKIEGMSCGHCSASVTKALKALDGVKDADVNLRDKEAVVETDGSVADESLAQAVKDAGFEVKEIK